jgi:hypothetical protein
MAGSVMDQQANTNNEAKTGRLYQGLLRIEHVSLSHCRYNFYQNSYLFQILAYVITTLERLESEQKK